VDPEVAQLLQTMAAFRAIPPVTARTEFITNYVTGSWLMQPSGASSLAAARKNDRFSVMLWTE
jgi:hypothetical protein